MQINPEISVVLPVYNGEKYLKESICSVLEQTYKDFELIVFDDGSTDSSLEIIETLAKTDDRIVVKSRENRGLVETLNESIDLAKGKYIARMDADDICYPDRFEKQHKVISALDLDILGGAVDLIENDELSVKVSYKESSDEIKASILTWRRNFCHPAVMFKKTLHNKYPYENFPGIEDFALWVRLALDPGITMGNLSDSIIQYRVHSEQVTQNGKDSDWHLKNQLSVMQRVVGEELSGVEKKWVEGFEKLLRSRKRFIRLSEIKAAMDYIDAILKTEKLSKPAKIYFLCIIYLRLSKKSKPKNKFFCLYRIKKKIRSFGGLDFLATPQIDR